MKEPLRAPAVQLRDCLFCRAGESAGIISLGTWAPPSCSKKRRTHQLIIISLISLCGLFYLL